MSAEDWKPGDVAMLGLGKGGESPTVCMRDYRGHWRDEDGETYHDSHAHWTRRLVVIDAEDREQVERLLAGYYTERGEWVAPRSVDKMQAALREFANPRVKPDEPQEFGAKVRDARGNVWLRTASRPLRSWRLDDELTASATWDEIDAVEVIA